MLEQSVKASDCHTRLGRPKKGAEPAQIQYHVHAALVIEDLAAVAGRLDEKSCYANIHESELDAVEVIHAYKQQNTAIENMGFRFLKDPLFFVSSLFLKKPSRIMGLMMVMTLALLVYSIAQHRIRKALVTQNETVPNQIRKPTKTPTMRWIFQLMDGIHFVTVKNNGILQKMIHGWTDMKQKIVRLIGKSVVSIYQLEDHLDFHLQGSSM